MCTIVMRKSSGDGIQKCSCVMHTQDRGFFVAVVVVVFLFWFDFFEFFLFFFFNAVHVYSPLHPTLNNVQFSRVGADVFILCYLKPG